MYSLYWDDELYHHGIKGQKWGIRRYQNPDGTRTQEGKEQRRKSAGETAKYVATQAFNAYALFRLVDNGASFIDKTMWNIPVTKALLAVGGPYGQTAMAIFGAISAAGFLAAGVDTVVKAVKDHKKFNKKH